MCAVAVLDLTLSLSISSADLACLFFLRSSESMSVLASVRSVCRVVLLAIRVAGIAARFTAIVDTGMSEATMRVHGSVRIKHATVCAIVFLFLSSKIIQTEIGLGTESSVSFHGFKAVPGSLPRIQHSVIPVLLPYLGLKISQLPSPIQSASDFLL